MSGHGSPQDRIEPQVAAKIREARALKGQNPGDYPVDFASVGEAMRVRAAEHPNETFLIFVGDDARKKVRFTFGAFSESALRLASALRAQYGIGPGDRVATLMVNHPSTVLAYFALWSLGAVVVPINVEEGEERVRMILENSRARLILAGDEHVPAAKAAAGSLPILISGSGARGEGPLEALIEKGGPGFSPPEIDPDQDALIVYTSGTTGVPKGVLVSQYNLLADARGISEWHSLQRGDRMMCVLPIHHVNGTVVTLVTPMYAGASVVLNRRFSAGGFWKLAAEERVAIVSVVPTLLHFLYERNDALNLYDLSRFRHFICGAGPLTVDLASRFEDRFGIPVVHGYGLSETTCYSCFLPVGLSPEEHRSWMRDYGFPSIGVPIGPNEMAIHDSEGKPLPSGERGEIVIRGHNVMKGYYRNLEANRTTFAHGWFRSGDEGFCILDPEGRPFFFITGRIKELIARGGVKFSPLEIDEVLNGIPGVRRGVAVGFENDAYGEEVGAYVELEQEGMLSEAEVLAACRAKLPFSKCPKVVRFGREIPFTSTGKIQRVKLKALFGEYKGRQFRE